MMKKIAFKSLIAFAVLSIGSVAFAAQNNGVMSCPTGANQPLDSVGGTSGNGSAPVVTPDATDADE